MPNFAVVLKDEIRRLAKKEARAATLKLQRASTQYRRDLARLKRLAAGLQRSVALLVTRASERAAIPPAPGDKQARFSPKWLAKHRARLGLSAADYAQLLGVSGQSIYHWEQGKAKPRVAQIAAIAALRKVGRREARRLLEMKAAAKPEAPAAKGRRGRPRGRPRGK